MENNYTEKIVISVTTKDKLTDQELSDLLHNMHWRLQGYSTESPEFMKDSKITMKILDN